jgi:hypothetical protein
VSAYYLAGGKQERTIEPFPRGLKMVASDTERSSWGCRAKDGPVRRVDDPPRCPPGGSLALIVNFPDCWDGRHLDVPDHTSHMSYATNGRCSHTHPAPVPRLHLIVHYPDADGGRVALGSVDEPLARHADFVNAWDQSELARLVTECVNAGADCGTKPPD